MIMAHQMVSEQEGIWERIGGQLQKRDRTWRASTAISDLISFKERGSGRKGGQFVVDIEKREC